MEQEFYTKEVIAVVNQIINLYYNSYIEDNRSESFECWLENGEVFKNLKEDGEDIDVQKCIEIAKKLAPIVDKLSNSIEVINEEEFEKKNKN